jgi:uncharacterized protein (DUF1501 family)
MSQEDRPRERQAPTAASKESQYEQWAQAQTQTRRQFIGGCALGLGSLFLSTLSPKSSNSARAAELAAGGMPRLDFGRSLTSPLSALPPEFAAKARRVIYLHMAGAPSQLELFDYKPQLVKYDGKDCPASFLVGKRFAFISGIPKLMATQFPFHQAGRSGAWISDRLPHLEKHIDDLCFIKSMHTDQFNHAPGQLLVQTGNARFGSASLGSWVTYGLGTENQNLPGFIVLLSGARLPDGGKQLWGSGFLPSVYQGVQCRSNGEPVLYLENPPGVTREARRHMLDAIADINQQTHQEYGNPETITRIAQYEMAFRMQLDASDAMDILREPEAVRTRYGAQPGKASFANNCLVARRLAERGVRFIQLYHWGWDSHGVDKDTSLNLGFVDRCRESDQPMAALLEDLKARGMLEDTLVVWGGEFGRTSMRQNSRSEGTSYMGRDHNPAAFTMWMAGGGVKPGISYGETDDMGYEIVKNPVEVRDLHATILYSLGFDHRKLIFPYQGLDQKLTGVKSAEVVAEILA